YNLYFFTGNGMDTNGEEEMVALSEPRAEAAPEEATPAEKEKPKPARDSFGNQPFATLKNLDLFGN
ncbi:MAG: HD family phosphohydrolase, partial [Trichlorobacter sp.]|nr:HD family phosphohydrolase [Trichlorobacter sp.]